MKKYAIPAIILIVLSALFLIRHFQRPAYFLSVAAIMKNEKPYLKEWLEYHRLVGVEHFYLCDNDSTDNTREYLTPYINSGLITYIEMSGKNKQLTCYEKVVSEYKDQTTWLAFIDIDEYMVPLKKHTMTAFLKEFEDVAEVSLHWLNYGDSGAFTRNMGLMTEFFTSHGRFLNHTVKSIVRPKSVIDFKAFGSNHYVRVNGASVNEYKKPVNFMLDMHISADKARINHYITKSFAEFLYKKGRGHPEGTPIDFSYYFFHNENEIKDDTTMRRFLPHLKKRMQKSPLADVPLPVVENLPAGFSEYYFSPEVASEVLGQNITAPLSFYELETLYKNRRPRYN
ncbi:MAG: glycosyltransferase family 92 protein [Alphaproteobacteria bacterium]|nr:glycosyltransferase family 92 protein [Alphaproteobacteria bacterium]